MNLENELKHLLSAWSEVAKQVADAKRVLLLTDYDGTLTPITETPELATLPEGTRLVLEALAKQYRFRVGIISGRALADLKDKVGIKGIIYAGNHGLEIEGPGISFLNPLAQELRPLMRVIHYVLSRYLEAIKGAFVEDKGLSLSVHYRLTSQHRLADVERIVKKAVGGVEAAGQIKICPGKKVYELMPAVAWDKGKAVRLLMKRYGKGGRKSGVLPIFLGDDLADEEGFKVIENYGTGVSVLVGEERTDSSAHYFLKSPVEVAKFLESLLEQAHRRFRWSLST